MKSVTIELGNAVSRIECDRSVLYKLDSALAVLDPGAQFACQKRPNWDGYWHFLDVIRGTFPTGLKDRVLEVLPLANILDGRERPPTIGFNPKILEGITLADHQVDAIKKFLEVGNGIIGTSVGCHAKGQGILMHDGSIKKVEDVVVGDSVMGHDHAPRIVTRLFRGRDSMFKIDSWKGESFVVNSEHILTLALTRRGWKPWHEEKVVDLSVKEFLRFPEWKQKNYYLIRSKEIKSFGRKSDLPISPYFLGILLGDGSILREPRVTTMDPEIVAETYRQAALFGVRVAIDTGSKGKSKTYRLANPPPTSGARPPNPLTAALRNLGLMGHDSGTKFIPDVYKRADSDQRLELLAGLIDTDGSTDRSGYDYITKSPDLARDVAFVARSLGFPTSIKPSYKYDQHGHGGLYYRLHIGGDIFHVPCRISKKRAKPWTSKKNPLYCRFSVAPVGEDDFFGFQLTGDGRYLLEGFTVTHNSGKTEQGIAIACHVYGKCVWLTHRKDLLRQTFDRIYLRTGEKAALVGDGCWDGDTRNSKFMIVMPQTAITDLQTFAEQVEDASVLIIDECHTAGAASSWFKVAQLVPAYYRCGLTGSPEIGDPVRERRLEASTGKVLVHIKSGEMAERGWIAPAEVVYHKVYNNALPGADYATVRRTLIEENPQRNAMIVEIALEEAQAGRKVLIICDTIRHARIISTIMNGENIRSRMLCGRHPSSVRSEAKRDFKSGVTEIMITTPIWDVGVDIPELEVVILAAGGKSAVRVIQRAGRALRKFPGKKKATIHDFFDTGSVYTIKHSRRRMATCKTEGFELILPDAQKSVTP